jgi:superfamily II DNA/RNA helicase
MVGELAALKATLERKRSIFLLPMRALVNDKYDHFVQTYGDFGIRTIRATGEIADDVPDLMRGQYDICLMTNEKFAALALQVPHLLDQVALVVVDEAQLIADPGRGVTLEFLLTMLKVRTKGRPPQVILLSAVIGDANGLDRWLDAELLRRTDRPVPLDEGVLRADGAFRYIAPDGSEQVESGFIRPAYSTGKHRDWVIPLVKRLTDEGQQVIVFRATKAETRFVAEYLANALGLPPAQAALDRLPASDPSVASGYLRRALQAGVGFHNSDLDRDERHILEEEFRAPDSALRVLVATTTLAMGINTPASSVVIVDLEHPGQIPTPYAVAEYKNMVGRAGRLGFSEKGRSFLITPNGFQEHTYWQRYVKGDPEDIVSRFPLERGDPASLITRVLAAAERPTGERAASGGLTADEVVEFLAESYAASLRASREPNWTLDPTLFVRSLGQLATNGLVEKDADDRYFLTALGRLAGQTGTEARSVMRLAGAIRGIPIPQLNEQTILAATQLTVELDDTYIPLNKRSKNKEPGAWAPLLRRHGVSPQVLARMSYDAPDPIAPTMRAKRAAACLMWMSDMSLTGIERQLTQFGGGFDAAGPLRSVVSRTLDLLPTTVRITQFLHPDLDLGEREADLYVRIELGLPEGAAPLARGLGGRLTRGDYLSLGTRGLLSLEALARTEDADVAACLDGSTTKVAAIRAFLRDRRDLPAALLPDLPTYSSQEGAPSA